jgi:hypothetical protein
MTKKKSSRRIVVGQPLTPQAVGKLNALNARRNEVVLPLLEQGQFKWPKALRVADQFADHTDESSIARHPALFALDDFFAKKGKGKGKGKSGGKSGGTKSAPKWPDPAVTHSEIQKVLHGRPVAGKTGNVVISSLNCEFGNKSKVQYFSDSYVTIFALSHIQGLIEVSTDGVAEMAKITGLTGICGTENSRQQAVGCLVHPRMGKVTSTEYTSFSQIQNIQDLRPALRVETDDAIYIIVHPKSMLGGPLTTAAVRYQQFEALAKELKDDIKKIKDKAADAKPIIVMGDMNFRLQKKFNDADPLYNEGFKLIEKNDQRQTQAYSKDSRIDGFFYLGIDDADVGYYDVTPFFLIKKIGRAFTDHALVDFQWLTASKDNTSEKDQDGKDATDALTAPKPTTTTTDTDGTTASGDGEKPETEASAATSMEELPDITLSLRPAKNTPIRSRLRPAKITAARSRSKKR